MFRSQADFNGASAVVTRASFLAAIGQNPEDDSHRLVFSDWLEENGEPARAEFVRLQLTLAKMAPDDPGRSDAERREAELLAAHRAAWLTELPRWAQKERHVVFRRGFVAELSLTEKAFLNKADELFAVTPLEGVRLRLVTRDLKALTSSPRLSRLRKLDLTRNVLKHDNVVRLAKAKAPNLTELILDENDVDGRTVQALLQSKTLVNLERLSLRRTRMCGDDPKIVAKTPNASRLRSLNLHDNQCNDEGVTALANSPHLSNLSELDLGYTVISPAAIANLAGTPLLPRLRRLELGSNYGQGGPMAAALAAMPHQLYELGLGYTDAADEGAIALANSPASTHLRVLNLFCCGVKTTGAEAIANSPHLANLTHLNLGHNFLDAKGIAALAKSPYLNKIVSLQVSASGSASAAKKRLAARFGERVRM
jgi:uncharacterized protein (TIGR02996 family)